MPTSIRNLPSVPTDPRRSPFDPRSILVSASFLLLATASQAAVVFSDNFDSETLGNNLVPQGFTVTGGTVDVIGSNFSGSYADYLPGHGAYIDLDGSSFSSGLLSHSQLLTGGIAYTATFDLAGSQNGSTETGTVSFGAATLTYSLLSAAGFAGYALAFTPTVTGSYALSFQNNGGDNVGALLDNVLISETASTSPVPEPATYSVLVAGLGAMTFLGRRHRKPNLRNDGLSG